MANFYNNLEDEKSYKETYVYSNEYIKYHVRKMVLPRTNLDGLTKVYVEVVQYTYNGTGQYSTKFKRIGTNIWIDPKHWNKKKELVYNDLNTEALNTQIDKVFITVQKFINSKGIQTPEQAYYERFNFEVLHEFFPRKQQNRKTLNDYFNNYIEFRKKQNTPYGTLKEFKTCQNRIKAFDLKRNKITYLENINMLWSDELEAFLYGKNYNSGTIEKTYTILVTVLYFYYYRKNAMQLNLSDEFSYKGFKRGKKSINKANPLTKEQLKYLYNYKFDLDHLNRTKTRFLIQCYTGLRYSDLFRITKDNIKKETLIIKPLKTNRYNKIVSQPLHTKAKLILENLNYDTSTLRITNQVYNRQLKEMFDVLRVKNEKLKYGTYGSHNGRDTFISQCVENEIDWKTILNWTGQSSYKIMDRYIKVSNEYEIKQMRKNK
jgi:integrase